MPKTNPTNIHVHRVLVQAYESLGQNSEDLSNRIHEVSGLDISDRAIRDYFNKPEGEASMLRKNIDALCIALLGVNYTTSLERVSLNLFDPQDIKRYRNHIEEICGYIRVLDMDRPMPLNGVYTEARFLGSPRSRAEKDIAYFFSAETAFPYTSPSNYYSAKSVVEENHRLMILGLPGAGKTTFLRHLALYSLDHEISGKQYLPIYIELRYVNPKRHESLLARVLEEVAKYIHGAKSKVEDLLGKGQVIILLDGLDEVSNENFDFVYQGINELIDQYPANKFIVTCRTKSFSEYKFASFIDFEMAGFSHKQSQILIDNWFKVKRLSSDSTGLVDEDEQLWLERGKEKFVAELKRHKTIERLISNPLLLTFLLYTFEYNNGVLCHRKITLCHNIVDIFIKEWDRKRRIHRRDLNLIEELERETLVNLLSFIAYQGFTSQPIKYEWTTFELEDLIKDFLGRVDIRMDARSVLNAIEANHGLLIEVSKDIYTFQQLTFQEYFCALYIVENQIEVPLKTTLEKYFLNFHWQEVFPLAVDRLSNSDAVARLVFVYLNHYAYIHPSLKSLLTWLDKTNKLLLGENATSAWAALLIALDLDTNLYTDRLTKAVPISRVPFHSLASSIRAFQIKNGKTAPNTATNSIALWLAIIYAIAKDYIVEKTGEFNPDLNLKLQDVPHYVQTILELTEDTSLDRELKSVTDKARKTGEQGLVQTLEDLSNSKPQESDTLDVWESWLSSLQKLMIDRFNICHEVKFTDQAYKILEKYIYGHNLLIRCLTESMNTTAALRTKLIDNCLRLSHDASCELCEE